MIAASQPTVLALGTATITTSSPNVALKESIVTFVERTIAASETAEIAYYDARAVVDGARYPALAAVWENDDDNDAFAKL